MNLVCIRTWEKGAVTPEETDPDLLMSVQETLAEVCCGSLLQGWGTDYSSVCMGPFEGGHHYLHYLHLGLTPKGNVKECSNYHTVTLISHASKVVLKILQARLQHNVNRELSDVQTQFGKGRGTTDQIANICWITEKATKFQKNIYLWL